MPKIDFLLQHIPDKAYNTSPSSNIYRLLSSVSEQLDMFVEDTEKIRNSKFVDYAEGEDLDKIARILNLERLSNENDRTFRGRIKSKVPSFIGGGTLESIRQVIVNLLGVEPSIIEHYKPGDGHAFFDNGVIRGFESSINSTNIIVNPGIGYVQGNKFDLIETNIPKSNGYLKYNLFKNTKHTTNYKGKVSGSFIENPHMARANGVSTELISPIDGSFSEFQNEDRSDYSYPRLFSLDGITTRTKATSNLAMGQMVFSINIVEEIEQKLGKIPKQTMAEKVQWCKDNVDKMYINWYGYGSSPTGAKSSLSIWRNDNGAWYGTQSHTNNAVSRIKTAMVSGDVIIATNSSGFVHFLAHSEPSDGVVASTINTDYFECEMELKDNVYLTIENESNALSNQILLSYISDSNIEDRRVILDPSENYITNNATITIQVPYAFSEDRIKFEDAKKVINDTKAAGIAALMRVVGLYEDSGEITEYQANTSFLVGFSGVGSDSFIGGQL
jgi:hypothetical protein